jgi:hypothetical protein
MQEEALPGSVTSSSSLEASYAKEMAALRAEVEQANKAVREVQANLEQVAHAHTNSHAYKFDCDY